MKNIITILNVQNESLKDGPSHLKFASDYFARSAPPHGNKQVKVINYYFKTDHYCPRRFVNNSPKHA